MSVQGKPTKDQMEAVEVACGCVASTRFWRIFRMDSEEFRPMFCCCVCKPFVVQ